MVRVQERFWEIDLLRGMAIVLMISYHALFDLRFCGSPAVGPGDSFWYWAPRSIASIFVLLAGLSLSISHSRAKMQAPKNKLFFKYLRRGAGIFLCGMAITAVTWLLFPDEYIIFGILHFIGLSVILAYPFLGLRCANLALGAICIAAGVFLEHMSFPFSHLLFIGFVPHGFASLDYFPLLPWFGLILWGIFLGNILYAGNKRRFFLPDRPRNMVVDILGYAGQHSLIIYLLHQPLIVAFLCLLGIAQACVFFKYPLIIE